MEQTKSGNVWPFVLGLLSTILAVALAGMPYIALALGIIGLVMSVRGRRNETSSLMTAGFVLSIIGVVLSGIELIAFVACVGVISSVAGGASHFASSALREALWEAAHDLPF